MDTITSFFGEKISNRNKRIKSYDFIENFIALAHPNWSSPPNTSVIVEKFLNIISEFSLEEFAFLMLHSGYIPEQYEADSSAETLYSKLIEAVVLEWAKRIGFIDSKMPTQKASMEDVSILDAKYIIVCDAKSFRLGRSQGAPNVKDVLKHADIEKWLSAYKKHERLGGLVTFPSQHDWKRGSDFYQYTTDKSLPTASLYYEHLAYILLSGMDKSSLINLFNNYSEIFPNKVGKNDNNREHYYENLHKALFSENYYNWVGFNEVAQKIISEKVFHCTFILGNHLLEVRERIESKYRSEPDIEILRKKAIDAEYRQATEYLHKQKERIAKFRSVANGYYEE